MAAATLNPEPLPPGELLEAMQTAEAPPEKEPVELLPWLPCTLVLEVPAVKFTVRSLLALKEGCLVETAWHQSTDIPLRANGLLMAWTEFEVVGERLAARITDLI
ncbi:MAG TPA: FliM/FliN family flagellar motor C-terminal domain-containing protein [Acidobacteriaceae bacterium]